MFVTNDNYFVIIGSRVYTELKATRPGKYNMLKAIDKLVESLNKINPLGLVALALVVVLAALLKG